MGWPNIHQVPPEFAGPAVVKVQVDPPSPTWEGRTEAVGLLLKYLTTGQKALLYRLLHGAEGLRLDRCRAVEEKEARDLRPPKVLP